MLEIHVGTCTHAYTPIELPNTCLQHQQEHNTSWQCVYYELRVYRYTATPQSSRLTISRRSRSPWSRTETATNLYAAIGLFLNHLQFSLPFHHLLHLLSVVSLILTRGRREGINYVLLHAHAHVHESSTCTCTCTCTVHVLDMVQFGMT